MGAVTIRQATLEGDDLKALIALGAEMHPQSSFADLAFEPRQWGMFLVDLITHPQHAVFVAEAGDEVVGGVAVTATPSMFGPDLVAAELGLFVRPERRASGAARGLIEAYLAWAREMGCKRVNVGNSAGMDDSRYVRLMQHAGFERAGSLLYMTL